MSTAPRKGEPLTHHPFEALQGLREQLPLATQGKQSNNDRKGTTMSKNTEVTTTPTPSTHKYQDTDTTSRQWKEINDLRHSIRRIEDLLGRNGPREGSVNRDELAEVLANQARMMSDIAAGQTRMMENITAGQQALAAGINRLGQAAAPAAAAVTQAAQAAEKKYLARAGDFLVGDLEFHETVTEPMVKGFVYGAFGAAGVLSVAAAAKALGLWTPGT